MREFLLGALTAGLTYALIWYQVAPAVDVVRVEPSAPRHAASSKAREAPVASASERRLTSGASRAETAGAGPGARPSAQQGRGAPEPAAAEVFIEPLPTALPKTIERMAELQRISADPNVLADRVQAMETDEADLAELKAFAERFVELPPDRVQRHVPGTSRAASHSRRAARQR